MIRDFIITICALLAAHLIFLYFHGKDYSLAFFCVVIQAVGIIGFIFMGWKEISLGYSIKKLLKKGNVDAAIKEANKKEE